MGLGDNGRENSKASGCIIRRRFRAKSQIKKLVQPPETDREGKRGGHRSGRKYRYEERKKQDWRLLNGEAGT